MHLTEYIVDRDEDIFADELQNAYIVTLNEDDPFRIDGKLSLLDRNDYIGFTPTFTGTLPFALSQFNQNIDVTISEISSTGVEEIYSVSADDMDINICRIRAYLYY